ncbi:hypothetical protein [Sphingobacterium haloxyli]|uniref:Preprotein translocase subunit SecD n=1 Tax=Sphingobacterium haloxyli TaxID=2100533 RepID=A0A2S9J710_9SPHI|nr:hypothetical protein [Sphingobacterium haloxyli]PRD48537.1 hypothetical protein C5745_04870 [Sphingobacterium haloxyli]
MKQVGLILLYYLTMHIGVAQGQTNEKQYIGRYGHYEGVCLFDDGQFLLYGYATAVFGRYTKNGDKILFYPARRDLFEVYGHRNPQIEGEQSRWQFIGFEEGATFAQFDQDSIHRVFNVDANCFTYPYITNRTQLVEHITLRDQAEGSSTFKTFHFANTAAYNDFVLVYNKISDEQHDFVGRLEDNVLKLSNYGGDNGYLKQEEDKEWEEILQFKAQHEQATTYRENSYIDVETQLQYDKVLRQKNSNEPSTPTHFAKSTIFHTVCEDSLELYQ